jgi:hypothetical protein
MKTNERNKAIREAAAIASQFTVRPDARIHPDIAFEEMGDVQQTIAHTTAQQIAFAILDLLPEDEQASR